MFQRKLSVTALVVLACCALPVRADSSAQQFIHIHQQQNNPSGQIQTKTIPMPAGGAVSVDNLSGQLQVNSFDPRQSQRWLVRLKDQPLQPYLKQQREKLAPSGKLSRSAQQQLAKSSQTQLQRVQKSQSQVLGELRKQKLLQKVHGQFTQLTNTLSITATADSIEQIRRLPQVAAVYPDNRVEAFLAESVEITKAPQLWSMRDGQSRSITGQGVTVAVLDTGIDYTHPDLGGCIGAGCKVAGGHNFVEGEDASNPIDKHGHGTHVAGIIAAKGTLTGVAPDVTLYAYKVLSDQGWGMDSSIIAAIEKAVDPDGNPLTDDQIDIINMSLGGGGAPDSPLSEAANNAMAAGVVVIVAAGNSGSYSSIGSPGNAGQVLTVGASDNNGAIAGFSSRGPVIGQTYIKPELVAPGVDINSAKPGGSYVRLSGTSMATPHVAGGAALLKQLHPTLSPAELKALLVNTSRDLGQDVFTQGAGMMDLAQAASASLLVTPSLLSAGAVDLALANWSAAVPFTLKNIATAPVTVSLDAPATTPTGASATLNPGAITLASGESAAATLNLVVDTQALPFADNVTLHHEVVGNIRYGSSEVRLPLVFAKAARLNVEFDAPPYMVHVLNADGSYGGVEYFNSCTDIPKDFGFDLKPGTYHLAVTFYDQNCMVDALVFKENVSLQDETSVKLERASALHEVAIGTLTGSDGNALSLDTLVTLSQQLEWRFTDVAQGSLLFLSSGTKRILRLSDVSDKIQINVTAYIALRETNPDITGDYYLLQDAYTGVSSSQYLDLDLRSAGGVDFTYADRDILAQGVKFAQGLSQMRSSFEFVAFGTSWTRNTVYSQPLSARLHADISTLAKGEWYPTLGVDQVSDDPFAWNLQLMNTGTLAFLDASSFTKLRGVFSTPDATNYRSKHRELRVTDSAHFVAPAFYFSRPANELKVQSMSEPYWWGGNYTIQRDLQQNNFFDSMAYRLFCNGTLTSNSETNGGNFNLPLGSDNCNTLVLELDQPVRFLGNTSTSHLRLELDVTRFPGSETYLLKEFPEQLQFFSDGTASRVLNGSDLQVQLDMLSMTNEAAGSSEIPVMEYQLAGSSDWVPVTLTKAGTRYVGKLPVLSGSVKTSLRITLVDADKSVKLVQTLADIVVLGQNATGAVIAPPSFAPLPSLNVEASAALTPYSLPVVFATDERDGQIAATTENLGPYAIGSHLIRWQATNSAGKTATGFQSLDVRDTTGPVIQVPANITVEATGVYTDIPQPQVTAYDAIDGEITAWTMDWKPFPVGTSYVHWNASDSRYNLSYVLQTVTVTTATSSQASSSTASSKAPISSGGGSSGGGGGGGSISLWWILLFAGLFAARCYPCTGLTRS